MAFIGGMCVDAKVSESEVRKRNNENIGSHSQGTEQSTRVSVPYVYIYIYMYIYIYIYIHIHTGIMSNPIIPDWNTTQIPVDCVQDLLTNGPHSVLHQNGQRVQWKVDWKPPVVWPAPDADPPTVETEWKTERFDNCYGAGTFEAVIEAIGSMTTEVQLCCESLCRRSPYAGWIFDRSFALCHRLDPKTTLQTTKYVVNIYVSPFILIENCFMFDFETMCISVLYAFFHLLSVTGLAMSFSDTTRAPHRKWLIEKTSSTKRDRSCRVLGISWWDYEHPWAMTIESFDRVCESTNCQSSSD